MKALAAVPSRVLGRGNPKELGADQVGLYPCPGRVRSAAEYAAANVSLLSAYEQPLLLSHLPALAGVKAPADIDHCLTRAAELASDDAPAVVARRSGGRSALWLERGLKFKGCRPVADGATYPMEVLSLDSRRIEYAAIPFGTISPEGVMRELLAWAFCREHGQPSHMQPACVFEYVLDGRPLGCCLVAQTRGEDRIEAHIDYPACSIGEVIQAKRDGRGAVGDAALGSELRLRDVNLWRYVEAKSRLLCDMHFHGGFRGILNSNIGNDVLLGSAESGLELSLCDFDTFRVVEVPADPGRPFIEEFVLRAMIEVMKGSLSICDYVEVPDGADAAEIVDRLGRVYFEKSSLWRAYIRRFEREARERGWDAMLVRDAFAAARRTEALANVLASCVINSHYLRTMSRDRNVFYPHN